METPLSQTALLFIMEPMLPVLVVMLLMQEKEATLGAKMAAEVRREAKPMNNGMVRDYIDRLARKLSTAHFTFEPVWNDFVPATHEPLAIPGGTIFVPAASILKSRDEAEFAAVLAQAMAQTPLRSSGQGPVVFFYGSLGSVPVGMQKGVQSAQREADRRAVRMASDAGFDPAGLVRYLERLEPRPDERIASLSEAVRGLPVHPYSTSPEFPMVQETVRVLMPPPPSLLPRR